MGNYSGLGDESTVSRDRVHQGRSDRVQGSRRGSRLSRTARTYLHLLLSSACAAIVRALWSWSPQDLPRFLFYLILAAPAASLKVRLPGITGTMSVLFVFLLAGLVELGLAETIAIGSTCVIIQSVWKPKVRPRPVQLVFSVANIAMAITVADLAYTIGSHRFISRRRSELRSQRRYSSWPIRYL